MSTPDRPCELKDWLKGYLCFAMMREREREREREKGAYNNATKHVNDYLCFSVKIQLKKNRFQSIP